VIENERAVTSAVDLSSSVPATDSPALLEIRGLRTAFETEKGQVVAVDGLDLRILAGQTLGVVGESGCGKSVTALSILRLIPDPPGKILGGSICLKGEELLTLDSESMRKVRGKKIGMIFQEPMTSLNPVFTIGDQIGEALRLHEGLSRHDAIERSIQLLESVGIPSARERVGHYPHQLSGGMRQRVMIAMALSCSPELLIADEPTTALDVTIQAQILDLLRRLQQEQGMAVMLITHDLGVVAETCRDVLVMYAGRVVERVTVEKLFEAPAHPYTQGLLRSIPSFEAAEGSGRLPAIPGTVPSLLDLPSGCRFRTRCVFASELCAESEPPLTAVSAEHEVACFRWEELHA